eukprot:TRINITY_DN12389_c0_g1_i1.p1 TRINITY_DN12389_c0_g1~~TRINITY_DN12389_c0_g1_i1.p1  ORF type:complete len:429 (+),score=103.63 TRINITY_DN12389_c0_g1_i1:38-1324(+)
METTKDEPISEPIPHRLETHNAEQPPASPKLETRIDHTNSAIDAASSFLSPDDDEEDEDIDIDNENDKTAGSEDQQQQKASNKNIPILETPSPVNEPSSPGTPNSPPPSPKMPRLTNNASVMIPSGGRSFPYGIHSAQGRRKTMEDSHCAIGSRQQYYHENTEIPGELAARIQALSPKNADYLFDAFFGVFDGHGGRKAADFAAATLHLHIAQRLQKDQNMSEACREATLTVEKEFMHLAEKEHLPDGTTAAVAVIKDGVLCICNVGDSEAVLCRGTEAIPLTRAHNPQKNSEERDRIVEQGGRLYNDRLAHPVLNPAFFNIAVSRSIGDIFFKHQDYVKGKPVLLIAEPYVAEIKLCEEDKFMVVACDGLLDVMNHQEIVDFVLQRRNQEDNPRLEIVARELVEDALDRGSSDNVTVMIVDLVDTGL